MASEDAINLAYGVGGRLAIPKSPLYRESVVRVEARANRFVARHMLASDIAYVLSAVELGVTPKDEGAKLLRCLVELLGDVDQLTAGDGVDIVTQREAWVAERVGRQIGSRLHVGRNRGESVRNYLPRMFFQQALFDQRQALIGLIATLHAKAQPVLTAPAPVYHHLQHAGVTTLGEYLLSWAANLVPHLQRLEQAEARLGVGAPAQSGRDVVVRIAEMVSRRLGFARVAPLRQQMHVTEDQLIEPFFAIVMVNVAMSRLLSDLRLWMTSEFEFFNLSDAHASGSSVLPQKKNPFGFQVVIGGAAVSVGRLTAQLASSIAPCEELDSVFNAGSMYQQTRDIIGYTRFVAEAIGQGEFNLPELEKKSRIGYQGAAEALDELIYRAGVPMRLAHHELGNFVRADIEGRERPDLNANLEAELGRKIGIDNDNLIAIVRGEIMPETALNMTALYATSAELAQTIVRERARLGDSSGVERAIAALLQEVERYSLGQ